MSVGQLCTKKNAGPFLWQEKKNIECRFCIPDLAHAFYTSMCPAGLQKRVPHDRRCRGALRGVLGTHKCTTHRRQARDTINRATGFPAQTSQVALSVHTYTPAQRTTNYKLKRVHRRHHVVCCLNIKLDLDTENCSTCATFFLPTTTSSSNPQPFRPHHWMPLACRSHSTN